MLQIVRVDKLNAQTKESIMNYEEFKTKYLAAFKNSMKYSPDQAGSGYYMEQMAALHDQYPEFAERAENEI